MAFSDFDQGRSFWWVYSIDGVAQKYGAHVGGIRSFARGCEFSTSKQSRLHGEYFQGDIGNVHQEFLLFFQLGSMFFMGDPN